MINVRILHWIYAKGWLLFQKYICILMKLTKYECKLFDVYILSLIFLHWNCSCIAWFYPKKQLIHRGFLEYVVKSCGSWVLVKGAPPQPAGVLGFHFKVWHGFLLVMVFRLHTILKCDIGLCGFILKCHTINHISFFVTVSDHDHTTALRPLHL